MKTEYLLIDLENVVPGLISDLLENQIVLIFTGSKQTKIGRDLVISTQPFGKQIQWIIINGNGKNAADFHIAYYMGLLSEKEAGSSFTILSKDTGFDPLIKHLISKGVQCRRIEDIKYFGKPKPKTNPGTKNKKNIDEIVTNLTSHFLKSDKLRRPKKLNKFLAFVKSRGNLSDDVVKAVVDKMIFNKLIEIKDEKINYSMDDLPF
jgi:hypothetical protein